MADRSPDRLARRELREKRTLPHKGDFFALKYLGRSLLDVRLLGSSVSFASESWLGVPDKLPVLTQPPSKRVVLGFARPVMIKRRRDDFQQSIKDLGLSYIRSKAKQPFAGVVPFSHMGKLERILPIDRLLRSPCDVGLTVVPAAPTELCPSDSALNLSQSISQLRVRRRKQIPECRSVGQLMPKRPSSPPPLMSSCSELLETRSKAHPYLYLAPKLSGKPPQAEKTPARRGHASCTCSSRQYLTASLHYQQLFLRAPPSAMSVQQFAALELLQLNRTSGDSRKLALVILFDGVLGDCSKVSLTDDSPMVLRLRGGAVSGLHLLQQHFQLVLISKMSRKRITIVLNHFSAVRVHFEAAYRLGMPARKHQFLVYERVKRDLQLHDLPRHALVLSSLLLSYEDLDAPSAGVLVEKQGTRLCLTAECVPVAVPASEGLPIAFLVPALQAQSGHVLSFYVVAKALLSFRAKSLDDWVIGFRSLVESEDLSVFSTSVVHQVLMSQVLPQPRADCFLSPDLPSHMCNLHERLAWGKGPTIHPFSNQVVILATKPQEDAGAEVIDSHPVSCRSGYLNLLDYVQSSSL